MKTTKLPRCGKTFPTGTLTRAPVLRVTPEHVTVIPKSQWIIPVTEHIHITTVLMRLVRFVSH